jgi:hypothetical protein
MSIVVQRRRGTTVEHATFTGALGEITVDTDKKVLVVHDGATPGGHPLAKESDLPSITEKYVWNTKSIAFYIDDVLKVETNTMSIIAPIALTVAGVRLAVDATPVGADLIIDLNINGTTAYTMQANRPTIAAGNTSAIATLPDITSIAAGDKISLDIDQIGSTTAGENLAITIICEVA